MMEDQQHNNQHESLLNASAEDHPSIKGRGSFDGGAMCLELALEGERLIKAGDIRAGVAFFHAAIQSGTDDLRSLSAIYSQLGNAYFFLGDYNKAMNYHRLDLALARSIGDKLGEAKSSGNLGNTLKVMGRFAEAIACCERHLEISRELEDRLSESRALYNLGNVYHAQGKQLGRVGQSDPGQFPEEVRICFNKALSYYEQNLALATELGDKPACGRAYGNLGNTCYLLGDFNKAIKYHAERLQIAQECGDKLAERRAHSNLGNSHIFLGQFETAAEHYKRTLALAQESGNVTVEAQACYSLGNTYTLLGEYATSVEYHVQHLTGAQHLGDKIGEGRASWSLGNAYAALGNHEKALHFAEKHLEISKELGDSIGVATAQLNISDLRKVLGLPPIDSPNDNDISDEINKANNVMVCNAMTSSRVRRQSMEQLNLLPLSPDAKSSPTETILGNKRPEGNARKELPDDMFFDMLSRHQGERMDDQRATLRPIVNNNQNIKSAKHSHLRRSASTDNKSENNTGNNEAMLEMISSLQSERMDSQRASLRPVNKKSKKLAPALKTKPTIKKTDDDFFNTLSRVQGARFEDQRSELPRPAANNTSKKSSSIPEEDFFSLIMRVQGRRMEDQRATTKLAADKTNRVNDS